jgi:hypothetical protein
MKKLVTTALLGLASVALIATDARAATLTPNVGDLILGFRITDATGQGANQNLEVDLGNIATSSTLQGLLTLAPGQTISLNALSPTSGGLAVQDLINTYGANWASRTDLAWGLFAASGRTGASHVTGYPLDTLWADENPSLIPYQSEGRTLQAAGSAAYEAMISGASSSISNNTTSTANSADSVVVDATQAGSWSFQQNQNPIVQFAFFNGQPMDVTEGTGGTVDASFYHLIPQPLSTQTAPGVLLGTFSLSTTGGFTYTAAAVPEASSMGLVGVGFLSLIGMVVLRRRRSAIA